MKKSLYTFFRIFSKSLRVDFSKSLSKLCITDNTSIIPLSDANPPEKREGLTCVFQPKDGAILRQIHQITPMELGKGGRL